ncbi:MAG: hypothetical protein WA663_10425 [Candidatus Acidiferrales bacterium]
MLRRNQLGVSLALLAFTATAWNFSPAGGQVENSAQEILARSRVFPEIGPGMVALKRDSSWRYYILAVPANTIAVYGSSGKRIAQIPSANSGSAKIAYAEDMDLDSDGRLYVADRGANAVKVFGSDGALVASIPVAAPTSVAALSGHEFAVATMRSARLVSIFDFHGNLLRSFGEFADASERADLNQYLNRGRVFSDPAGHIYFAFTYLPEPTFRKYDRYGYAAYEVSLASPEFASRAQAERNEFVTLAKRDDIPAMKSVISALGVDPATQEVWAVVGDELLHFDKDGDRLASYRTATSDGAPLEPIAILVEPDRILLAADPYGIFDFARPDKLPSPAAPTR